MQIPPEPDPATAIVCPDCGELISPEGLAFLTETLGPDAMLPVIRKFHLAEPRKARPDK